MGWLTGKVAMYVCGALILACVALGFGLWAKGVELGHCENKVERHELRIKSLELSIKGFQQTIADQNKSIEAMKTEGEKKSAEAAASLKAARDEAARSDGRRKSVEALLRVPTPSGAKCDRAISELRKGLQP